MNIEELLQALPSREDIANAVGLYNRNAPSSNTNDLLPALAIFSTGMILGAGLALLFAPKPGSEIRRDIADKAQELGGQARSGAEEAGQQGRQLAGQIAERGRQMVGHASETVRDELTSHVSES